MKSTFRNIVIAVISLTFFVACGNTETNGEAKNETTEQTPPANTEEQLRAANQQLYAALNTMFTGDTAAIYNVWSHGDDVTYCGPWGEKMRGWEVIKNEFGKTADLKLGGSIECKDLVVTPGTNMGYTVCVEEGANKDKDGKPVTVHFRATNIFRLENGAWKLVHHHTDLSQPLEQAYSNKEKTPNP